MYLQEDAIAFNQRLVNQIMKLKQFFESLLKTYGDLHCQTTGRGQDFTEFFIYYYIQVLHRRKIQTKSR